MNKEISLLTNTGSIYEEDNLKIEITNLSDFLQGMKETSNIIPAPHFEIEINFKVTVDNTVYEGKTTANSYEGLSTKVDTNCPLNVEITDWKLGEATPNPSINFKISEK